MFWFLFLIQRHLLCNSYCDRKRAQLTKFTSWTKLFPFHTILISSGKIWFQFFSLQLWVFIRNVVKYSLADDMVKILRCRHKVMHWKRVTLWTAWQLFPLDHNQTCHSKDSGSAYSIGQLWEEIVSGGGWWKCVVISPRGSWW